MRDKLRDDAISKASGMRFEFYSLAEAQSSQRFTRNRTRIKRMTRIFADFLGTRDMRKFSESCDSACPNSQISFAEKMVDGLLRVKSHDSVF